MLTHLQKTQDSINEFLDAFLPKKQHLSEVVRYAVLPTGKCLRANLLLETANSLDVQNKNIVKLGAAIELIHSYSLVHDDLPALDNDDIRRSKPSCHKAYGEANAILTGNYILMLAFKLIGNYCPKFIPKCTQLVNEMITGQSEDLTINNNNYNNKNLTINKILMIYRMKTGALFAMATSLAAYIAQCNNETYKNIEYYGYKAGVAFQIADDIVDNSWLVQKIGKEKTTNLMQEVINKANFAIKNLNYKGNYFTEFTNYIAQYF